MVVKSHAVQVHQRPTPVVVQSQVLDDVSEIPALLDQIDAEIASMTADGAYDGAAVYDAVAERHPEAAVIIPPRATAHLARRQFRTNRRRRSVIDIF
jgi:hypothetical protein